LQFLESQLLKIACTNNQTKPTATIKKENNLYQLEFLILLFCSIPYKPAGKIQGQYQGPKGLFTASFTIW